MVERGIVSEQPVTPISGSVVAPSLGHAGSLEERIARLEDAVAGLQDTRPLEERVLQRVTTQLASRKSSANPGSANPLLEAGRRLLPTSAPAAARRSAVSDDSPSLRSWLLFDVLDEARTMWRMFVDRNYSVSWITRTAPPVALIIMLCSWFFLSNITLVGGIVDKLVDLVLVVGVYKILHREALNYRLASAELKIISEYRPAATAANPRS